MFLPSCLIPAPGFLGSIGGSELLLILLVVLIVFGPASLKGAGKTLGKSLRELKKAADDLKAEAGVDDLVNEGRTLKDQTITALYSGLSDAPPRVRENTDGTRATDAKSPEEAEGLERVNDSSEARTSSGGSID